MDILIMYLFVPLDEWAIEIQCVEICFSCISTSNRHKVTVFWIISFIKVQFNMVCHWVLMEFPWYKGKPNWYSKQASSFIFKCHLSHLTKKTSRRMQSKPFGLQWYECLHWLKCHVPGWHFTLGSRFTPALLLGLIKCAPVNALKQVFKVF